MRRCAVVLLLVALALAGCRRPDLDVRVVPPEGYDLTDVSLELLVFVPGDPEAITCERLRYDDLTLDSLAAARALAQPLDGSGTVPEFPVFPAKLVVVEARDAEGVVAMRGCTPLGELDFGPQTVEVALEVATELSTDEYELRGAAVGEPVPALLATARDYRGEPAANTEVRLRLVAPGDVVQGEVVATTGADGTVELAAAPTSAGPFRLEMRAAIPRGTPPDTLPGLALPADSVVDPFARPGADWLYVLPTRFQDGVAFVGRTNALLNANADVVVARVRPEGGFEDTGLDPGLATIFLGSYVRADDGRSVLVFAGTRSALGLVLLHDDGETATVTFPERFEVGRALPIGPCDDPDTGPAVMGLVEADSGALDGLRAPTHLALLPPDGGEVLLHELGDERFDPLLSTCEELDGVTYRVLLARANGRMVLRALPDGLTEAGDFANLVGSDNPLPGALVAGHVLGSDDGNVVTARLAGFSTVVELQRAVAGDDGGFALAPSPAFGLPALPSALAAAPLLGGSPAEVVGVFSTESGAERGILMVGAREPDDAQWTVGAAPLDACARSTCELHYADVDGDGAWEVYAGMGFKLERGGPAIQSVAQVLAFE